MKLEDTRKAYQELSGKASELTRQLALTTLAIAWLFRKEGPPLMFRVPDPLFEAAKFAITALALDLLQYILASLLWGAFGQYKQNKGTSATDTFEAPNAINWPALFCYWLKIAIVVYAYAVYVLPFLYTRI
jgi:hypothetical protein